MSSTYSPLKIELQATGENTTTWGEIANDNFEALEQAIAGSADVTFASANVTISLTDTNASQTARNLRLRCTGTTGGARNLVVPTIEKAYLVKNECADTITVKTSAGTGVAVPTGKALWVYVDGTNVVDPVNHLSALSVAGAASVGTTLAVTGITNLGSTLNVSGSSNLTSVSASGAISGDSLTVDGLSTAGDVVAVTTVFTIDGLGNYANDAAAAAGGVVVDQVYRNGSVLMIRVA